MRTDYSSRNSGKFQGETPYRLARQALINVTLPPNSLLARTNRLWFSLALILRVVETQGNVVPC